MQSLDNLAKLTGKCPSVICSLMLFSWLSHGSQLEGHALYLVDFGGVCFCVLVQVSDVCCPLNLHTSFHLITTDFKPLFQQQCSDSIADTKALGVKIITPEILTIQANTGEFRFSLPKRTDYYLLWNVANNQQHLLLEKKEAIWLTWQSDLPHTSDMSLNMQEYWLLAANLFKQISLITFKDWGLF